MSFIGPVPNYMLMQEVDAMRAYEIQCFRTWTAEGLQKIAQEQPDKDVYYMGRAGFAFIVDAETP